MKGRKYSNGKLRKKKSCIEKIIALHQIGKITILLLKGYFTEFYQSNHIQYFHEEDFLKREKKNHLKMLIRSIGTSLIIWLFTTKYE